MVPFDFLNRVSLLLISAAIPVAAVVVLLATLMPAAVPGVDASSSSGSSSFGGSGGSGHYNPYNYDGTVQQFTPDGRLLQVEYAARAADVVDAGGGRASSFPTIVLPLLPGDGKADGPGGIGIGRIVVTARRTGRVQERLVVLSGDGGGGVVACGDEPSSSSSSSSRARSSSSGDEASIVVGLTGVVADSLALLGRVAEGRVDRLRMYGSGNGGGSPDGGEAAVRAAAGAAAAACQLRSFGGGIRPYGTSFLVGGLGRRQEHRHQQWNNHAGGAAAKKSATTTTYLDATLLQTDPSGAVRDLTEVTRMGPLVIGGGGGSASSSSSSSSAIAAAVSARALQRRLDGEWPSLVEAAAAEAMDGNGGSLVGPILSRVLGVVLEEIGLDGGDGSPILGEHQKQSQSTGGGEGSGTATSSSSSSSLPFTFEIVVLSPAHGIYKLTDYQVGRLLLQQQQLKKKGKDNNNNNNNNLLPSSSPQ